MSAAEASTGVRLPRLGPLYARAALALAPRAHLLPGVPGGGGAMPQLSLRARGVRVEPAALVGYRSVCGFGAGEVLPVTYPHVLAFPLQMALMTNPRFPFGPVGLVHVENRIRWSGPLLATEPLEITVTVGELRAHPKGSSFTITTAAQAGDALWVEESTMLRRRSGAAGSGGRRPVERNHPAGGLCELARWRVGEQTGRRYAAVSGDRNPIHLHPRAARLFGFRRAIAHGMWTLARALAELDAGLAAAGEVNVTFARPLELPGEVRLLETREAASLVRFEVRSLQGQQTLHLTGSVSGP